MKQKVWTYKKNGNEIFQCYKELENVREHIFYYTEPTEYGYDLYYLVVENKGEFFDQGLASKTTIENVTWEQVLESVEVRIANNGYFNQLAIKLMATISDELCHKARQSNEIYLQKREQKRQERIEKERQEREKREKEEAEARAADDAMIAALGSLLKPSLSKLQRGQALSILKQELTVTLEGKRMTVTYFDLITKYGYNKPSKWEDNYTKKGDVRSKPVNHYYLNRDEDSYCYEIPGRLGTLFNY